MNNATEAALNIDVYAIYLRKSRADMEAEKLGEGETLARHKKILLELASRKGLYIGKIYEEIVSGDTIEARPEMKKLINDCYAGKYKGILIVEATRLSRGNQGDAQIIMDCLKYSNMNNGVLVITPTKTYDVAHSQEDEEYMEFELFMSRREYKMIHKRMDRGRKQAVVEGNFMGTYRPYGYDIVKGKKTRTLVPNEYEAPILKQIFEWAAREDMTPWAIAKRLSAMGVKTYHGDTNWTKATIQDILKNPVYTGKVRWNRRMKVKTMINNELKTIVPRRISDQYMLYDGKHKRHALVDEETFKLVQNRYPGNRTRSTMALTNPLAGVLRCKKCDRVMFLQSHNGKRRNRYTHTANTEGCKVKSAIYDDVIAAVEYALRKYIDDFELKIEETSTVDELAIAKQIDSLRKEVAKIKRRKSSLIEMREDRSITHNEFIERKAVHDQRLEALEEQIYELEHTIPEKEEFEDRLLKISDALIALTDDELDAETKNIFIRKIVRQIDFSRENGDEFILDIDLY
jgi:DNA invertase Pin-like site-specific DNA recombinase